MPRVILKCPYLSPNSSADRGGYAIYIATRDGVEIIPAEKRALPSSHRQRELIGKILRDFPGAEDSFEHEDYIANPTMGNASEFITRALEDNYTMAQGRDGYAGYIAQRPHVAKVGEHGLFGAGDGPVNLSSIAKEIREHPGNVWAPILSLRREDATRLGYDHVSNWQALLRVHAKTFAENLRIRASDLVWYAAYHDEGHHPHVHMLCYSRDPSKGFLTVDGIRGIKSEITRDIFRHELEEVYKRQTLYRSEVNTAAQDAVREMAARMMGGVLDSGAVTQLMASLAERLRFHSGKMVYGYLRPPVKAMVDSVVDELEKDPRIAEAYKKWCEARQEIVRGYKDTPEPIKPLSQNPEFKPVRNMVVKEAAHLMRGDFIIEQPVQEDVGTPDAIAAVPNNDDDFLFDEAEDGGADNHVAKMDDEAPVPAEPPAGEAQHSFVAWTDQYRLAMQFLYGTKTLEPGYDDAYEVLLAEADAGNALAKHDLGRMHEKGLGRDIDSDAAQAWYEKALDAFLAVEPVSPVKPKKNQQDAPKKYVQYRIGKMYNAGLGTQQDHSLAAEWFRKSAGEGYKYAQYSLGCLYRDGKGVPQDHRRAFHLFEAAADQDFPYASFECGKMLRDGVGTEKNIKRADIVFTKAFAGFRALESERPDDKLQYRLGWMLLTGTGAEKDVAAAAVYFEKAAKQNNPHAQYQLAKLILAEPDPALQRIEEAIGLLTKAACAGLDSAQYALGKLYLEDERIRDVATAMSWLLLAAQPTEKNPGGNPFAQYRLGKLLLAGLEVQQDIPAALAWLEMAAVQQNQFAQYALGMAWLREEQAGVDAEKAVPWLLGAAEQGNPFAAYQLGKLFLAGDLVEKDTAAGLKWMTMAAEAENQYAQYALGKFYLFGDAELRDEQAALHWLTLAAAQGNPYATFLLERRDQWHRGATIMAGTRLLGGIGQIFTSTSPLPPKGAIRLELDRKRRKELQQKKGGKGIRQAEEIHGPEMAHP